MQKNDFNLLLAKDNKISVTYRIKLENDDRFCEIFYRNFCNGIHSLGCFPFIDSS